MSTVEKTRKPLWGNILFLVSTPLAALVLVPVWATTHGITAAEIAALIGLWLLTGIGITAGYHRLFSHRAFKAAWPVRLAFAICGAAAWQGSIIRWSSGHRYHHRDIDTDGDPYDATRGFWWSHIGWVMFAGRSSLSLNNVPDLWKDPICRWQHRYYLAIGTAFNVVVPLLLGLLFHDVLGMLLFAGLVRVVLVHHFTFTINSLAHMFGRQPWSSANTSRDNWVLSLFSFGEGYHNFHHRFPSDYRNGPRLHNFDPSKWLIFVLGKLGLAQDLRRTPLDVMLQRRFHESRLALLNWLVEAESRLEAWGERRRVRGRPEEARSHGLREAMNPLSEGLQTRLRLAEQRVEAALGELKLARQRWGEALRARSGNMLADSRRATTRELHALEGMFREARRTVLETMREWETTLLCARAFAKG